ncbi:MAG: pyridoxal-phosphate-dependent aminotransferase family protein [Leptolyngbyaceae cyanobacterium]
MDDKFMLMIPGPTPVPESVLLAQAQHLIGHRSGEFSQLMGTVADGLKWLHQTQNEVLMLTASGTGAMEAGIINVLSVGDRVLVGSNGKFGDRWVKVCQAFGLTVDVIETEWGKPLNPNEFQAALTADTDKTIKAVLVTHSETSTGVLNDLKAIADHTCAHGALMLVDAVTSLGACNVPVDEWGLDVVASGSQKGYMVPPGLGFVTLSDRAWQAYETANIPKFYFDLGPYRKSAAKNMTPFTPPVSLFFALQVALKMMQEEGLEQIFTRHAKLQTATRAAMRALNLPLFAADAAASPAVTAVMPQGVAAEQIRQIMRQEYNIALAGGQDHLKGQIFRLGHLGFVSDRDILTAIAALEATLAKLGANGFTPGAGLAAAQAALSA